MAELVFQSLRKIRHADWLPKGLIVYDDEPIFPIRFLSRSGEFWRENLEADFNETEGELSICIEIFRTIKCAETLVVLLFKVNYIKVQYIKV